MIVVRDRLCDCGERQTMLLWGEIDYVIVGRDRLCDCGER